MSLITPNGMHVPFDQERIEHCIQVLKDGGHIDHILMEVDLWENMPNAISTVLAIGAAFMAKSTLPIIMFGVAGYILGTLIKVGPFSRMLLLVFPASLGSQMVTTILAVGAGWYLYTGDSIAAIIVLFCIVTNNGFGTANIFEVLTAPIRRIANIRYAKRFGFPYTHIERTFVALCNHKAKDLGISLPWKSY